MKRVLLFCLTAALLLTLCGCFANQASSRPAQAETVTEAPVSESEESVSGMEETPTLPVETEAVEETLPPEPELTAFNNPNLLGILPFSEGIAWIQFEEAGEKITAAIDTEGKELFRVSGDVRYCAPFKDGLSYYVIYHEANINSYNEFYDTQEVIVDSAGNELYRTSDGHLGSEIVDEYILAQGDGEFLVFRHLSGMEKDTWQLGTIDAQGNVVSDWLDRNTISTSCWGYRNVTAINGDYYMYLDAQQDTEYYSRYLGDGIYYLSDQLIGNDDAYYVPSKQLYWGTDYRPISDAVGGRFVNDKGRVLYVAEDSIATDDNASDGLFGYYPYRFREGMFYRTQGNPKGYYDVNGNLVVSMEQFYPELSSWGYGFTGDYAVVEITGQDDKTYFTIIDRSGQKQFDPMRVMSFDDTITAGYAMISDEETGHYWFIDMAGNRLHDMSADFDALGAGNLFWYNDHEAGALIVEYEQYGARRACFYFVEQAVAAGDSLYDPFGGAAAPLPAEEETASVTEEKTYIELPGLSIVGKWKSIGEYGFGQAQPGAIVAFDGTNCNFFSPMDTYAFYQSGSDYILECTSFMSTDTVTFTVKVIDEDHIDVMQGGYTTELMRVE